MQVYLRKHWGLKVAETVDFEREHSRLKTMIVSMPMLCFEGVLYVRGDTSSDVEKVLLL